MTPEGPVTSDDQTYFFWAHHDRLLTQDTVEFVARHFDSITPHLIVEAYSRFSNALRLHNVALASRNSDLALLGFVGAIESLFSVAAQELSFRLSFLLSKFLGKNVSEQRDYFSRAKELYKIRSKIAHGDKIAASEESSAIQLSEHWIPEAEELSRLALRRVIEEGLIQTFNSKARHERLLDDLLFFPELTEAVRAQGT